MKILIIQPWIRLGGAELISVHLAYELQQRGHDTAIVCTFCDLEGMPNRSKEIEYVLPPHGLSRWIAQNRLGFLLLGPWILLALTWKYSRDVDILNPHNFPSSWIAVVVGALRNIPVVWTCNEPPERLSFQDALKVGIGDYFGWLLASSWLDKLFISRVGAIHVPSEKTRKQVIDRYNEEAIVINLGIEVNYFKERDKSNLPWELDLDDKFVMLTVGKLHPQKNHIICIEALQRVVHHNPNVVLLLAGDGPLKDYLKSQAKILGVSNYTYFLGHCNGSTIRKLYQMCDINLFPPINQSWGFTPFEALCADKISIVSNDSGAAEVIANNNIGLVCEPTAKAFANLIIEVSDHPNSYMTMAERGHKYVSQYLNWEIYSQQVLEIMKVASSSSEDGMMDCEAEKEIVS